MIDELRGDNKLAKGFQTNNVELVIDMKKSIPILKISANILQDTRAWIIMLKQFIVEVSADNKNFTEVYNGNNFLPIEDLKVQTKEIEANFSAVEARYVRVKAIQYGKLPSWHEGAGNDSHIFIDEISIK